MRKISCLAVAVTLFSGAALAQDRKVYSPQLDLGDNANADLRLIEESKASKVSGVMLDLCFARNVDSSNGVLILGDYDRVVVPLKINANELSGAATSSEAKRPIAIKLQRRAVADGKFSFSGTISIDGKSYQVSNEPVFGLDPSPETEYLTVLEKPQIFDETASPNTIAIKFKAGSLPQLLEALRTANAKVDLTSGAIDKCAALRSGQQYLRVITPVEESQALVAAIGKLPFVIAVGWTSPFIGAPAARVSGARWVNKGLLNREKAANELSAAIAKHIGAIVTGTTWDSRTGELKATFKRPSKLFPGVGLTENFQMAALIAPEQFGETDRAVVWTPTISGDVADERDGARLSVIPLTLYAGPPEGIMVHIEPEVLGSLLETEWWDSTNNTWVKR